jgi:hypothetical protein
MAKGKKTGGRTAGVSNKKTREIKEAFKELVEGNLNNITKWMEQVAKENPAKALEFMQSFAQFNVPLLARTEHGGGIAVESTVRVIDDTNQ